MRHSALPALRRDLEVRFRRDGTVDVRDPRLLQLYTLDAEEYRWAQTFDGRRTAREVSADLRARDQDVSTRQVEAVAREFDELALLDTPRARRLKPRPEDQTPYGQTSATRRRLRVLPEPQDQPRWACHACGACCHGLTVEISKAEADRIDASLYRDILRGEDFAEWSFVDPEKPAQRVLRQVPERNNACIFLDERGLCSIHARQGPEFKPDPCQIFPHVVVHVPGGPPRLTMRLNCETMHETFEDGPLTVQDRDEVLRISKTLPGIRAASEVEWFGEIVSFSDYDQTMAAVLEVLGEGPLGPEVLADIDTRFLRRRARRARRPFGRNVRRYVKRELDGPLPVETGGYASVLGRVARADAALEAMSQGELPPRVGTRVGRFLTRQARQALYGLGPLQLPDAGYGLTGFVLALEAILHAVGPRGRLATANRAFIAFTAPLLETTHHAWPILEALDRDWAAQLKKEI
jgi:Fe-S-cluster containining protein